MIVEPDVMKKILRGRGVDQHKLLLVYDAGQLLDAVRVYWSLEVYGFLIIKLLSPGYDYWLNNNFPGAQEIPTVIPSKYIPTINHQRIASKSTAKRFCYDATA